MRASLLTAAVALTAFAGSGGAAVKPLKPSVKNPTSVVRTSPQGKLTRTVLAPQVTQPRPVAGPTITNTAEFDQLVDNVARQHQVDPLLVHAVIRVESNYNQFALSDKGAQGYMQLIPQTARQMGVANAFDTRDNIQGGVKYLRAMMDRFNDLRLAIAAYNAGPEAVERHHGIPPYAETQNYVWQVAQHYNRLRSEHPPVPLVASAGVSEEVPAAEPEFRPLNIIFDADGRLLRLETQ